MLIKQIETTSSSVGMFESSVILNANKTMLIWQLKLKAFESSVILNANKTQP